VLNTQVLTIKTMIYLLDAMDVALDPKLITWLRLLDINAWFDLWMKKLCTINALYKPLLEEDLGVIPEKEHNQYNKLINVDDGVFGCIKTRLILLQYWLRTQPVKEVITGGKILMALEKLVALQYRSLRPKIKMPE